jgi:hypothetical protein
MGVFGIRIHQIPDPHQRGDTAGGNPFSYLGYGTKDGKLRPMNQYKDGWKDAPYQSLITGSAAAYLKRTDKPETLPTVWSV